MDFFVVVVTFLLLFFAIERVYGTLKEILVKFKYTLKSLTQKLNHVDHIIWHRRCKSLTFYYVILTET